MYPHHYYSLFPAFPRNTRAFVAMSFAPQFDRRWNEVIAPALRLVTVRGEPLDPYRVDLGHGGDAILIEIMQGIGEAHLVVADLTTMQMLHGSPVRNANVMYEVGLAHATRLPQEVVLFRSDDDRLDFDVQGVRVHPFSPDTDPEGTKQTIVKVVTDSLAGLDATRNLSVRRAMSRLSAAAMDVLTEITRTQVLAHPVAATGEEALQFGERWRAISELLEVGAIEASLERLTAEQVVLDGTIADRPIIRHHQYRVTVFGTAIVDQWAEVIGMNDPDVAAHFARLIGPEGPS